MTSLNFNDFCAVVKISSDTRAIGFSVLNSKVNNEYLSFILIAKKISRYKRRRKMVVNLMFGLLIILVCELLLLLLLGRLCTEESFTFLYFRHPFTVQ